MKRITDTVYLIRVADRANAILKELWELSKNNAPQLAPAEPPRLCLCEVEAVMLAMSDDTAFHYCSGVPQPNRSGMA